MLSRIKKDDLVKVITGKDRGKQGQVLDLDRKNKKVRVRGVAVQVKHVKPRSSGAKGSIEKREAYIHVSNVMLVCPETGKPCRVRAKVVDGKKVRISHRSGVTI
jgi:large subunit ribosomal protein L24